MALDFRLPVRVLAESLQERLDRAGRGSRCVALPLYRGAARPPAVRVMILAALLGLSVAGCGASTPATPTTRYFVGCPLGPPWPFPVAGGSLSALSVEGMTCQAGIRLMTSVIGNLDAGKGTDSYPVDVAGWNCVSYDGNQTTCIRGHATLYAQYGLS